MSEEKLTEEKTVVPETISCAICRDLMPLVADGVASPESEAAVRAHLQGCAECRALWQAAEQTPVASPPEPDGSKIIHRLRRRIDLWLAAFVLAGLVLGLVCGWRTGSENLVLLIFPAVCGVACWFGGKAWRCVPPLAAVSWLIVYLCSNYKIYLVRGTAEPLIAELLWDAALSAVVPLVLCLLGALAAALLKYAFGGKYENKP